MTDIWTAKQNSDFIGLGAALMSENLSREVLLIDMIRMPGNTHNAENIKETIETMVLKVLNYYYLLLSLSYKNMFLLI